MSEGGDFVFHGSFVVWFCFSGQQVRRQKGRKVAGRTIMGAAGGLRKMSTRKIIVWGLF